jgi:hypothetical protein
MLVAQDTLGVLLATDVADRVVDVDGVRLEALRDLRWISWPRCCSPRWCDELAAVLGGHGIDVGDHGDEWQSFSGVLAAVSLGAAFVIACRGCVPPLADTVVWCAISDHPLIQRTWVVWQADSRCRDVGQFIAEFDV